MIINNIKLLGLKLYEKQRISEIPIELSFDPIISDEISLFFIGKNPRLKYQQFNFSDNFNWSWYALISIRLAIFNLVNNDVIEIIRCKYEKTYLFNLFRVFETNYYFKILDLNVDKDIFSVTLFNSINKGKGRSKELFYIINTFITRFLGGGEYSNPYKSFLIKSLKINSKKYEWLEISEKKKYFGVYKDYNVKFNEIYIPRIKMQHDNLFEIELKLYKTNGNYRLFCDYLRKVITDDFENRKPSDNNDFD
ncbi:hypothetical protein [Winogradskyella immobilis]|uniref:Uncharacterized protein n=1 Tax=Winogradskyella immobilis TaxID=2816852 RepID=A0ABS8ELY3_9FLAO|nr:hypothetical protein [Winogradskyella immobilis]MCC1484168.1 hypothetical protein [Winogradskyella immobilis]MCG0016260.1 hypothetical protein [Winogradskyella immobilis]